MEQWREFAAHVRAERGAFFDGIGPVTCARAPGRLDVLGGIADYSGSIVLESALAVGTMAAVQTRQDRLLVIRSDGAPGEAVRPAMHIPLNLLADAQGARPYADVAAALQEPAESAWAAYVAGCLYVLLAEGKLGPGQAIGLSMLIESIVPIGAGVSSSAALEVAVMTAMAAHLGISLEGMELARLCQVVENQIVGAPCGVMDQVTCTLGREGSLLALKCQPHELIGHQPLPTGWRFVGLDSGVKHSVGGRHYRRARIGAFMGLAIVQRLADRDLGGYLCNLSPTEWERWRQRVPETLSGAAFQRIYGALPDSVTTVEPGELYQVRSCAEHPILENDRVREMLALMALAPAEQDSEVLREAGRLLLDAHASYSDRVDLGSVETDLLVELAMDRGPERGIFGAKITGGGSGGTVALLCAGPMADAAIASVRAEYRRRTGIEARLLAGSSQGAVEFGTPVLGGSS